MKEPIVQLYTGNVPSSVSGNVVEEMESNGHIRNIISPTLTVYLPPPGKVNGTAMIVLPGGSYEFVSFTNEGTNVAEQLSNAGVTVFILKYRLPDDRIMADKTIGSLQDAQQAVKIVRQRAAQWNIDPDRIGIMGFSAGGHLASMVGTHYNKPVINPDNISLRPDFMVLLYPVINFFDKDIAHIKSSINLLGENPSTESIKSFSTDLQVTPETPRAFIMHANDDEVVNVENALRFHNALSRNNVPSELMLYPKGGHGFGITNPFSTDSWLERCLGWIRKNINRPTT